MKFEKKKCLKVKIHHQSMQHTGFKASMITNKLSMKPEVKACKTAYSQIWAYNSVTTPS